MRFSELRYTSFPTAPVYLDCLLMLLQVFAVFQASAVFYELRKGLGRTEDQIDPNDIEPMQKVC